MNLARFFQVTAVFLLVFVVQLLIYGFHELAEANVLPNSEALHWATEPYGPDGVYGQYLTYLLVALPLGWLAVLEPVRQGSALAGGLIFRLKAEATQTHPLQATVSYPASTPA